MKLRSGFIPSSPERGRSRYKIARTSQVECTESKKAMSKIILVFGATGAQGRHVINSLLASCEDGSPSPYTIRALTRNPEGKHALALRERGVELVKGRSSSLYHIYACTTMAEGDVLMRTGDTSNLASIAAALDGAYGAWVNIDGFTVGEQREIYAGMRTFELAKQTKSLRHYVWSSLDYNLKVSECIPIHSTFRMLIIRCAERGL
jgi:hypothetical protein